jgi:hypothetical protein
MAEKTLNTVIVLRNDKSTDWATSKVILKEGEVGVSYLDNGNVVVKAGDGKSEWSQLKQVEGVFEQPVTLTQNFGYFNGVTAGSYKTFPETQGMTTSEFILKAFKQTIEPTIAQPSVSLSATPGGDVTYNSSDKKYYGEIGGYIKTLNWDGSSSNGSYKVGSGSDQGTGISSGNFGWTVSNNINANTSNKMDGSFSLVSDDYIQINSTSEATYATISAVVTLDASNAKNPKNNLGEDTTGKITATTAGAPWDKSASIKATGYRKPFWGVVAAADGLKLPTEYTSDEIRALSGKGSSRKGLPGSLEVPAGSQMVVFFADAGAYSSLTATDDLANNSTVTFTKVAKAVYVKGANNFAVDVEATANADDNKNGKKYDLFYVNWNPDMVAGYTGIGSNKKLTLKWS